MSSDMPSRLLAQAQAHNVSMGAALAQESIDAVLRHPLVRRPSTRTEEYLSRSRLIEAHASAALAGAEVPFAAFSESLAGEGPLSVRLRAAALVEQAAREQADLFTMSPPRALGAWHLRASAGSGLPDDLRGRPVPGNHAGYLHDELNLAMTRRPVDDCVRAICVAATTTEIPAVTAAGIAHALLAAGQPFASDNSLLARAAVRAILVSRSSDPDAILPLNSVLLSEGRPAWVRQIRSAMNGDEVTAGWLQWHAEILTRAAQRALADLERLLSGDVR